MIFRRFGSSLMLAIGASLVLAGPGSADEYRNESRHFTIQFPNTWSPVLKDALTKANELANQMSSGPKINYIAGFQRRGQPPLSYPYVLVQPLSLGKVVNSYEEFEKDLSKEFKTEVKKAVSNAENAFPGLLKGTSTGTPVLDRTTNRVILRMEMTAAGLGKIQGLSVGFLGAKDIVFLHCYALEADFDKYLPVFEGLFDSFQWDKGFAFTPGQGSSILGGFGGGALRGALIGGIIGGLVAIPVWFWQKWQKAQKPRSGNFAPAPPATVPPPVPPVAPTAPDTRITGEPRAG
jgi:hypothetical protein